MISLSWQADHVFLLKKCSDQVFLLMKIHLFLLIECSYVYSCSCVLTVATALTGALLSISRPDVLV